ncbi:MAG: hypothetical protein JSU80_05600, partial [Deltaproteobacteria bacterium]
PYKRTLCRWGNIRTCAVLFHSVDIASIQELILATLKIGHNDSTLEPSFLIYLLFPDFIQ